MTTTKPKKKPLRIPRGKRSDRLTRKQKIFVEEYALTENGTQSALKAYDTKDYNTANSIANENLKKPIVIKAIQSIADRIPDELLERVHLEGLVASDEVRDSAGNVVASKPDYAVRHKYLDTAYKLKNLYPKEGGNIIPIQINVNTDRQDFK
ncbi:MAG: terminase small subunit, partial [Candidatus Paceibacterota bacterium]|jgi:hypothetical protein